jgi:solute carrier family 35 protein F1/2
MAITEPHVALYKSEAVGPDVQAAQAETTSTNVHPKEPSSTTYSSGNEPTDAPHGVPEYVGHSGHEILEEDAQSKGTWFAYVKTKQFWVVLVLGQVLAVCTTSTNTLSTLLSMEGTSIPAFQSLFNYILLNIIYTSYTMYKYGFKGWMKLVWKDGWRFFILAFFDVEGNYFVVLAYRYTTILSAQLINFWAIVVVVAVSLIFLKVRYHWTQYSGILLCIGGMGILFGSDHLTGNNAFPAADQLKGDLFALLSATCYGLTNVFEEFLVSKRPVYEVIGQLAFWAMLINGVQAAIFDRSSFQSATWNSKVGGYMTGYTLILSLFYSLAPLLFRLSSAAFFNISLLTGSFWGVAIGVEVFHYDIHWMYPIAFVCIIIGQIVYFCRASMLAEANKPWLGEDQEGGVDGLGTAKRRVHKPSAIV